MKRFSLVLLGFVLGSLTGCGGDSSGGAPSSSASPSTPSMPSMPAPATPSTPTASTPAASTPMPPGAGGYDAQMAAAGAAGTPMPPGAGGAPMPPGAGGYDAQMAAAGAAGTPMPPGAGGAPMPMPPGAGGAPMPPGAGGATYPPTSTDTTMLPGPPSTSDGTYPGSTATVPMPGGTYPPGAPGTGGYPGSGYPGAEGSAATPRTLIDLANDAFGKGRDRDGFQYLYAAALVNEDAAETLPDDFRWVAYLKKPAMAVRWGIGIEYNPHRGYTGHPSPIGYEPPMNPQNGGGGQPQQPQERRPRILGQRRAMQQQQNQGGQPNYGGNPQDAGASGPPSDPSEFLLYYTGELGEKIVDELNSRIEDGKYGDAQQRALESASAPVPTGDGSNPMYNPMNSPMYSPMGPGGEGQKSESFKPAGILPGVVVLGTGSERDLIKEAEDQAVDFVILFDVTLRAGRPTPNNNTKFRVMSLAQAKLPPAADAAEGAKPREIYASKVVGSHRVETAREKGDGEDLVDAEITAMFAAIDAEATTTPLAEKVSDASVALKRATFLAKQKDEVENPLAMLAEIRCYHAKELLTDDQLSAVYTEILGGDKAKKLLNGKTEAERQAALTKWLPKS